MSTLLLRRKFPFRFMTLFLLLTLSLTFTRAAEAQAQAQRSGGAGQRALNAWLAGDGQKASISLYAVRLKDASVVASLNETRPVIPASVQKLASTAVAMAVLGKDFHFTTTLAVSGDDLIVVGDGDPTFGDPVLAGERGGTIYDVFDQWASRLAARGIRRLRGNLVLDSTIFPPQGTGRHQDWPANQAARWYCAPVGGLNFNNNCLDVSIVVSGQTASANVSPVSRFMPVTTALRVGTQDIWDVRFTSADSAALIRGQAKNSTMEPLSVAVNEPALLFGRVLLDRLARAGIVVEGQIVQRAVWTETSPLPEGAAVIAQHKSPLADTLARANKPSLNMMAECMLLRATAATLGEGTYQDAARLGTAVLREAYRLDDTQFSVADGSGMSRNNRLSAAAVVSLLRQMAAGENAEEFLKSMSVSGVDGTLQKRFDGQAGRIVGKTGSLSGVKAIAGYVMDAQNRPAVAFAILCNDPSGNWRAKEVQDALILEWLAMVDAEAGQPR